MKIILLLALLLTSIATSACTLCNSPAASQIRANVFGPAFVENVFYTLLPFVLISFIIRLIYGNTKEKKLNT